MSARPSRVVIVGRDEALWLTAAVLRSAFAASHIDVIAVELPTRLASSCVTASLPPLEALHVKLGVAERELVRATGGSFSHGRNFVEPGGRSASFFHAWCAYGAPVEGHPFLSCWLAAGRPDPPFHSYCATAVAALNRRLLLPDDGAAFGRAEYAYHLPARAYAGLLKAKAARMGVACHQARTIEIVRGETGIDAVTTDEGGRFAGDLFVDATGPEALLLSALEAGMESWRASFCIDRTLVGRAPAFTSVPPFAEVRANATGWTGIFPTQVMTGVVYAFCAGDQTDEAAVQTASAAAGSPLVDIVFRSSEPGLRAEMWRGNCVALGAAACAFDPVHCVELQALQLGIVHLLSLFPNAPECGAERAEFNARMRSCCERIRDFQAAFYVRAPFEGPAWREARASDAPTMLAHKIALFEARGLVAPAEDETFLADEWQALFLGLGLQPASAPAPVDVIERGALKNRLRGMREAIASKVREQQTHDGYLKSLL